MNENSSRGLSKDQPSAVLTSGTCRSSRLWYCLAHVAKKRTGKATGWSFEKAGPLWGASECDAFAERNRFTQEFCSRINTAPRKRVRDAMPSAVHERVKRVGAPTAGFAKTALGMTEPRRGKYRPGPGGGRTFEPAVSNSRCGLQSGILEDVPLSPIPTGNWMKRLSLRKE